MNTNKDEIDLNFTLNFIEFIQLAMCDPSFNIIHYICIFTVKISKTKMYVDQGNCI